MASSITAIVPGPVVTTTQPARLPMGYQELVALTQARLFLPRGAPIAYRPATTSTASHPVAADSGASAQPNRAMRAAAHDIGNFLTTVIGYDVMAREEVDAASAVLRGALEQLQAARVGLSGSALDAALGAVRTVAEKLNDIQELLSQSQAGVTQIADTTRAILAASRARPEDFSLTATARTTSNCLREMASQRDVSLSVRVVDSSRAMARGTPAEVANVVMNLIKNAIEIIPQDSERRSVYVTVGEKDGVPFVSVEDTGPGMSEEIRQKLLKGEGESTKGESNHGLGMWSALSLIAKNNGVLEIDTTPGTGSTFTARFPPAGAKAIREATPSVGQAPDRFEAYV